MKPFILLAVALAFVGIASALPTVPQPEEEEVSLWTPLPVDAEEEHGLRQKRATCDFGSFKSLWFTPNHSFCAAHCLFLGKKGGSCKGTICYCRD